MTGQVLCACGCRQTIENPRRNQRFYSDACRAKAWRAKHQPRCPDCGTAIEVAITAVDEPRSERQEGEGAHECD